MIPDFVLPFLTRSAALFLATGMLFGALAAVLARHAKTRRTRARRAMAVHLRLEEQWMNARVRMHLAGPIGHKHIPGTKYSKVPKESTNGSTNPDLVRYIGG